MNRGPALSVDHVSKRFPGTLALDDVSFAVEQGEFHALLGGNGSGKSTLIKTLAGVVPADRGSLAAGAETVDADRINPAWSRGAGIRFVHQDLGLFEPMTVAENIALSAGFAKSGPRIRWPEVRLHAAELLETVGLEVSPDAPVASLRPAQRTMLAIARALDPSEGEISLLVLDEPTARLPTEAVDSLLARLRRLVAAGTTVLYVTHRLGEVHEAADRITVLRDGKHVATRTAVGLDEDDLIELIVGRPLESVFPDSASRSAADEAGPPVLELTGLEGGAVRGVDLAVRGGEVLGVGGTVGAGRSSLMRLVFGDARRRAGTIKLEGREVRPSSPGEAMRSGIAYVPEDRAADAAFLPLGVTENLSAATIRRFRRRGALQRGKERQTARRDIERLRVRTSSPAAPLQSLSGGNQQKVVLSRWLRLGAKLLLLDEPTQGVDIGARAEIYEMVRAAAATGVAVIVASSDFEELIGLSDRVVVMAEGRVVAEGVPPVIDADWIAHQTHAATLRAA